jgi:hypothetical protein
MNKITPHMLRDLHTTLPEGTECYLCAAIRKALANYRRGNESEFILDKEQALPALAQRLGRGLKRFLREDIKTELRADQRDETSRLTMNPANIFTFQIE